MSTETAPAWTLDVSGTPGIPFGRLFGVELRKSVDTRAGRWLVGITIGAVLIAETIFLIVSAAKDLDSVYGDFVAGAAIVSSFLLPILGIMLVSSEWSQRTAMTTFSLEPRRMRVVMAKMLAGMTMTLFVIAFALGIGLVGNLLFAAIQGQSPVWSFGWTGFTGFLVTQTFAMLGGFALACLFLNTPAAIVVYVVYKYVLPGLIALGSLMAWFSSLAPWIDFQSAQNELYDLPLTSTQWWHLVVSGVIWLLAPLLIGLWRIRRAEVK
ncbi:MAG TPA: ABC transporter permease [Nocardioides sp.]|uniref:ABC transporter permease n=1 Tax=Nocardioides sp. TaxID=35761 RepID=UPI002F402660